MDHLIITECISNIGMEYRSDIFWKHHPPSDLQTLPVDYVSEWRQFNGCYQAEVQSKPPKGYLHGFTHASTQRRNQTLVLEVIDPFLFYDELQRTVANLPAVNQRPEKSKITKALAPSEEGPISGFSFFSRQFGLAAAKRAQALRRQRDTAQVDEDVVVVPEEELEISWFGGALKNDNPALINLENAKHYMLIDEILMLRQKCPLDQLTDFCSIRAVNRGNNCVQMLSNVDLKTHLIVNGRKISVTVDRECKISGTTARIFLAAVPSTCGRHQLLVSTFYLTDGLHQQQTATIKSLKLKCQTGVDITLPENLNNTFANK